MEIHFEIGNRCLLKCRHCSSMASEFKKQKQYSDEDMIKLLKSIDGKKKVYLTGGEPLLYKDLDRLLNDMQMQISDISIGMFTTGIMWRAGEANAISEEYARRLASCGLKVCYLSIYSHLEQDHDWMTRLQGSYKILNESITHLQVAGIETRFNSVVTKKNILCFNDIIRFAESMKITEVRILKLIRHGRANEYWREIGVSEQDYRDLIINILKRENKVRITASGIVDILPCREGCKRSFCPAGKEIIYVTNSGDIFPCASVKGKIDYEIGNISDLNIAENLRLFLFGFNGRMLCK